MKTNIFKRSISFLLALILCVSFFVEPGTTVFAAVGEKADVYIVEFPRSGEANLSGWGHKDLKYMNGWNTGGASDTMALRAIGSYTGKICYCIEPGTGQYTGDTFTQKDENFWNNFPSEFNRTIGGDEIKIFIGRILQYGYTGNLSTEWKTQDASGADKLSFAIATQILIWETIVGERNENFNHVDTGNCDRVLDFIKENNPIRSQILKHYSDIEKSVQNHTKVPSFCARSAGKAKTVEMQWDGKQYISVLTDSNGVLGDYNFSSNNESLKFSVSGNKLTITANTAPSDAVSITASKKNSQRKGLITWTDGIYTPGKGSQDIVTYAQSVSDPVKAYVKIKVSYGSAKIVKTSEDGKVDGVSFRVQGNGIDKTVKTAKDGQIQIDNLMPGVYTVTEQTENKYEPQETRRVTVVSGQTATVTFSNKLKRGNLTVTKISEDGINEGVKFHLYGTSLSGLKVDEYAVTDKSGKAYFKDVLIGSGYTLEEVDTEIRYVVPEKQTATIEWNKVTNKNFENILKKFRVTVTKRDSEKGNPQGDASLAGAVYGIYKSGELVDTYPTDANGQFTTKYYACGDDWTIKEITASEGYLVDETVHRVGADSKIYTVEYNGISKNVIEQVIKGKIAIIKHTDDGSTQIETPEKGAEFQIYLKSSGSFAKADKDGRDTVICDEDGFASSKLLPYGVYTVHQTKGWDGREKIKDFDVYIDTDMKEYKFLINNANFESYLKIVKLDKETGKQIAYEGAAFEIYDSNNHRISMQFTYPKVTEIHTFYTNSEGYLITPEKLPFGDYFLKEVKAPYGYVLDSTLIPFKIAQENSSTDTGVTVVKVKASDMAQKGIIEITKEGDVFSSVGMLGGGYTDENGNDIAFPVTYSPRYEKGTLANAVFQIYAAEDITTLDGTVRAYKGELVDEITTDGKGIAKSKELYLGRYTVIEKTSPNGYVNADKRYDVELTYAGQDVKITSTALSVFNHRQKVSVSLLKELSQDNIFKLGMNNEILSVQFGIYAGENISAANGSIIPEDALITYGNCNENGKLTFNCDLPIGYKFYVKEIATDEHYILSDKKYEFETKYKGQDIDIYEINLNDGEPIENDLIYGTIKGLKIDRETEETIDGAIFGLFNADETEYIKDNAILTAKTDKDGIFVFENIPFGEWIVKELQPAENYLPSEDIHHITVTDNEQIIEITAVNDRIPELKTTAAVDGEKEICATEVFTLTDTVEYEHLIPNKEYTLKGVLMDKNTGKELVLNGETVTAETNFIPTEPSGTASVEFVFDSKYIKADTDIVVFETLCKDSKQLAVHADIEDEGQTVTVKVPEIHTTAKANGKKEATAKGNITVVDKVKFTNLTPGKEYTIEGVLMDKSTGKPFEIDAKPVTSEATFIPEKSGGEVIVSFNFDAKYIKAYTELVVFETLYRDNVEIAVHADINDDGQTVKLIPLMPKIPQTGDDRNLGFWFGLGAVALGGLVSATVICFKKKKDDDSE